MPWGAITLRPGVDVQKTPTLNEAGVSQTQMMRYKEGLLQTYGGWTQWPNNSISVNSTIRDLHAWQALNNNQYLAIGALQSLGVISATTNSYQNITPQQTITNPTPNFSVSSGSNVVTIVDGGANATLYNTIYFNTPVALGSLLLNGGYPIKSILGSTIFTIQATANSCTTVASSGILPIFTISSGSQTVTVTLPNNNFPSIPGLFEQFIAPTTFGGQTIQGKYQIIATIDSTNFTINQTQVSSVSTSATMNSSLAQLVYYVTLGPPSAGTGFGAGGFGSGAYGSGSAVVGNPGTPITATDWTTDNWGEILLACPANGAIYAWSPDSGFQNAQVVNQAPFFNGGIFVAMPQQILVAWGSVQATGVQDPLIVRWSNQGDYTNWTVSNQTTAGSFHLPTGSIIVGGLQCPQFALISTEIEVWTMTYVGGTVIFNFNKVGLGCGWVSSHACGVLAGNPYWMSNANFYTYAGGGVVPMPCSVWDVVFQNLNAANQNKVRVGVNSAFNEIAWFYPSTLAVENDSYVKVHIQGNEYEWDYGTISRTAWIDVSVLGMPLGADNAGLVQQHEDGTAITGVGLPQFTSGYWVISEGEEIPIIDLVIPDFIYGLRSVAPNATVSITFFGVDYPNDTPIAYGPFTVTPTTEFINTRIRNRMLAVSVTSLGNSEFWRLGKIRFRFGRSGRR